MRRTFAVLALAAALTIPIAGQTQAPPAAPGAPRPPQPIAAKEIKPGLYMITGKGANAVLRVTADGAFLASAKVVATKAESDAIARYKPANGSAPPAAPNTTFDGAVYSVKLGGVEVRAYHFGPGATEGDLMVYFPDLKVLATGDDVHSTTTPNCDYPFGGSVLGWQASLKKMMALDFDTAIPGQGANVMTRAEVEGYVKKWDTLIARAQQLVKAGTPKEQLIAQIKTDDLGWNINFPFWTQPVRLDPFYAEMAR